MEYSLNNNSGTRRLILLQKQMFEEKDNNGTCYILYEAKTFEQAREHSYLKCSLNACPPRMEMKEAGWFAVLNEIGQVTSVCIYCKTVVTGWKKDDDPLKVHRFFSPKCVFITSIRNYSIPSSPILETLPHHEDAPPSTHQMAQLYKRTDSFNIWPLTSPAPSSDILAGAGLFYTGQNTQVECFFCHHQIFITGSDIDLTLVHTDRCKYAEQLREHSQRAPLNIKASNKIYELVEQRNNRIHFYFLQCITTSSPSILLSAVVPYPNEYISQNSDFVLKHLRPSSQLGQPVNWGVSSDGPLVSILENLAQNSHDLANQSIEIQMSLKTSLISSISFHNDPAFICRTCLTIDASPHIVSIKCHHLGLCEDACFRKWMTCPICGYTLGKTIRIRGV